jgi:hypothetical protein
VGSNPPLKLSKKKKPSTRGGPHARRRTGRRGGGVLAVAEEASRTLQEWRRQGRRPASGRVAAAAVMRTRELRKKTTFIYLFYIYLFIIVQRQRRRRLTLGCWRGKQSMYVCVMHASTVNCQLQLGLLLSVFAAYHQHIAAVQAHLATMATEHAAQSPTIGILRKAIKIKWWRLSTVTLESLILFFFPLIMRKVCASCIKIDEEFNTIRLSDALSVRRVLYYIDV